MTEVLTKKIATLDWINVEKIDTHNTQKKNFSEYNEEVYVSENNKKIIKQEKAWRETVKQIKIITKKVINIV